MTRMVMRGTPFKANGRVFVPEGRVTTLDSHEATLGLQGTRATGVHIRRIQPTALIEQTARGERRHRIEDATGRTLFGIGMAAIILPVLLKTLARRLDAIRHTGSTP